MIKRIIYLWMVMSGLLLLTACNNTRHLPKGEKLYTGATVTVDGPGLTAKQKKVQRNDLRGMTRPRPNSRFLGMRFKLSIYNLFHKKKPNSFFGRIRDKYGEPPVLLSQVDLQQNVKLLQNHLENKGWFHAKVTGDTVVRRKRAKARYKAHTGNQYVIDSIAFPQDSSALSRAIANTFSNTLLKVGVPFDLDVIRAERVRIDASLKENGFYYFDPDFIIVQVDTTIGDNKVNLFVKVKPETPVQSKEIYRIND